MNLCYDKFRQLDTVPYFDLSYTAFITRLFMLITQSSRIRNIQSESLMQWFFFAFYILCWPLVKLPSRVTSPSKTKECSNLYPLIRLLTDLWYLQMSIRLSLENSLKTFISNVYKIVFKRKLSVIFSVILYNRYNLYDFFDNKSTPQYCISRETKLNELDPSRRLLSFIQVGSEDFSVSLGPGEYQCTTPSTKAFYMVIYTLKILFFLYYFPCTFDSILQLLKFYTTNSPTKLQC